jgi:phosphate transport system substrate-binding protein
MKKHSIGKLVIMLVLMLAFVTGCANNGSKITIVGSSAMQNKQVMIIA